MDVSFSDFSTPVAYDNSTRTQILALSGGGYRGLFTACVLEKIELEYGCQIVDHFDLIAGTSAGALIAAALAARIPASQIREMFEKCGPLIFPRSIFTALKQFIVSPYSTKGLNMAMDRLFSERTIKLSDALSNSPLKLLITAVSFDAHRLRVFAGKDLNGEQDNEMSIRDALLASAAAPTYFPVLKRPGIESLVDGGLVANAPDLVALVHASSQLGLSFENIHLLSIGTAAPDFSGIRRNGFRNGIFRAVFSRRGLVQITLDSQEAMTVKLVHQLLKKNFFRVDGTPGPNQAEEIKAMDRTHAAATETLRALATDEFRKVNDNQRLRAFFSNRLRP